VWEESLHALGSWAAALALAQQISDEEEQIEYLQRESGNGLLQLHPNGGVQHGWWFWTLLSHRAAHADELWQRAHRACNAPVLSGERILADSGCLHGFGHGVLHMTISSELLETRKLSLTACSMLRRSSVSISLSALRAAEDICAAVVRDRPLPEGRNHTASPQSRPLSFSGYVSRGRDWCLDGVYHHFFKYSEWRLTADWSWPCRCVRFPLPCFVRGFQSGYFRARYDRFAPAGAHFPEGLRCDGQGWAGLHQEACVFALSYYAFLAFDDVLVNGALPRCQGWGYSFKLGRLQNPAVDAREQTHALRYWCELIVPRQPAQQVSRADLYVACAGGSAKWAARRLSRDGWAAYCRALRVDAYVESRCRNFLTVFRFEDDIGVSSRSFHMRENPGTETDANASCTMGYAGPILAEESAAYFALS
tara:strand:+ start:402 stop:1667 length:1266 start_codon:yes stop_codon:yes gene_type:complete